MAHKLLLADDSVTIQRVIELTFADEDIEVTTVGDGQLAIDRLDTDPPDIVLADVDMPKRDGYEVAAYVKSRPKLAHIPVVLLTGAFEPIDQVRAAAAGSSDVLAKPFEPQMVINRVKELLGKKRQNEAEQYAAVPRQTLAAPPPAQAMPQLVKPAPPDGQAPGDSGSALSLDDYFDQLDAAFSNLQPGAPPSEAAHEGIDWAAGEPAVAPGASALAQDTSAFAPGATADKPAESRRPSRLPLWASHLTQPPLRRPPSLRKATLRPPRQALPLSRWGFPPSRQKLPPLRKALPTSRQAFPPSRQALRPKRQRTRRRSRQRTRPCCRHQATPCRSP